MNSSNNVHRHKENFQFLGNSYKDKNMQKKLNKPSLEISGSENNQSPLKFKNLSSSKKDQLQNMLKDPAQFISPSRSHKDKLPDFFNDQIKYISPSHTSKNQMPTLLTDKNMFISPTQASKDPIQSLLSDQSPVDSPSFSAIDQKQNALIDQKTMTSPSPAQSKNNDQSYELKYKKAKQKIKGMQIIIDVLNARVQKAVAGKQEIEKQVLELKQQLDEKSQSQIIPSSNTPLKSIAVSPKSLHPSDLESSSLANSEVHDQRISNMFDRISHFEKTCDSAIQAFNDFQSFISSSSQIQDPNISNRSVSLCIESPNAQNKTVISNTSISASSPINSSIEQIKKKNKQLQAKIKENNETILQLNAKIRRRENENSMLKQQISDLQDDYNNVSRIYEAKQKKAQQYLYGLQQRYSKMQEEGDNPKLTNKNSDIIQILKENEALSNRVKELSMKNSELVRIIYKMEKGNSNDNKSNNNMLVKNDSTDLPKEIQPTTAASSDSPKQLPDKLDIPMSVKYSFNQETEDKSQDDSGVSCFIE